MTSKYYLATTALDELWETDKEILFLGDWCLLYNRKSFWESLNGTVIDTCFHDGLEAHEAYCYIDNVYERVLPLLADVLNITHEKHHDIRYWRIVIGPWLRSYLTVTYDRYQHIIRALNEFPDLTTTVLSENSFVTPLNTLDFTCNLFEDFYNLQIYSKIFGVLGKNFPSVEMKPKQGSLYKRLMKTNWKHEVIRFFSKIYVSMMANMSPIRVIFRSSYFPIPSLVHFFSSSYGRSFTVMGSDAESLTPKYDLDMREQIKELSLGDDGFSRCLSKMLFSDMPICFVEGYKVTSKVGKKKYPDSTRVIFSANSWYYDEAFKSWAASRSEQGAILLGTPHGGGYGAANDFFGLEHETSIVDYYYSWGWKNEKERSKVIPMPASKLIDINRGEANNSKVGVLWVTTVAPRYLIEFNDVPYLFKEYMLWQKRFLQALPSDLLPKVSVRAHCQDNGWGVVSRLREVAEDLNLDSWDVPFRESLGRSRIYVCDHLSTTFIEALASNKPTILFWNSDSNKLKVDAEPYFDLLQSVEILFDSPEAAAKAVSHAYVDVELWWNEIERQQAVKVFCKQFALTSSDDMQLWEKEINRVLAESFTETL